MPPTKADSRETTRALTATEERAIDRVVDLLRTARRLLFITGAGMSADSGLPTYRGVDGLYRGERSTRHGLPIEEALSGPVLASRPEITWQYLAELEQSTRGAAPNRGHRVIAEMEDYFESVWVVTQNVDGLHRQAGSRQVLDLHGDLHDLTCTRCDYAETVADYSALPLPPRCPRCQAVLRPAVVLFNEEVPEEKLARLWYEFAMGFDVVFSVGTSSQFDYIAEPVLLAHEAGIPTVEINPEATAVTPEVSVKIAGGAAPVLGQVWERYLSWWPWL